MRVCYWGTYEDYYIRNRVIIAGLRAHGVEVLECHWPLWRSARADKTVMIAGWRGKLWLLLRLLWVYPWLAARYLRLPKHDAMLVGHFAHVDVIPARLLAWLRRVPLVVDIHLSLYDMVVKDRHLASERSLVGRLCYWLDRLACGAGDLVFLAEEEYVNYFVDVLKVPRHKLRRVFIGADDRVFHPRKALGRRADVFTVVHFGKYVPLHGMEHILQAVYLLRDDPEIHFQLIGSGQLYEPMVRLAQRLGLRSVEFIPWAEPDELSQRVAEADVCLGIFADTPKASRVIANKIYEGLAMGKPVITRDSPAARELLTHRRTAYLCAPASGSALAEAIRTLKADATLREGLERDGYQLFRERCSPAAIGRTIVTYLDEIVHVAAPRSSERGER